MGKNKSTYNFLASKSDDKSDQSIQFDQSINQLKKDQVKFQHRSIYYQKDSNGSIAGEANCNNICNNQS